MPTSSARLTQPRPPPSIRGVEAILVEVETDKTGSAWGIVVGGMKPLPSQVLFSVVELEHPLPLLMTVAKPTPNLSLLRSFHER